MSSNVTQSSSTGEGGLVSLLLGLLGSAWLWGTALTFGFYFALPHLPLDEQFRYRYFCSHWIEYATVGLFFVGAVTLFFKAISIPGERAALSADVLDGLTLEQNAEPLVVVDRLEAHLRLTAKRISGTQVIRRLRDVCTYVRGRRTADGLEDHLNYLAEIAAGRLNDSYDGLRTIIWAVPILGFLGTVIGITMAIANITPDQLSSSLSEVTAGLAVAFDTTALSLSLSFLLVFGQWGTRRNELKVLDHLEDFAVTRVLALFPSIEQAAPNPLLKAETLAAEMMLRKSEELITRQAGQWEQSLEMLREKWLETMSRQQELLEQSLVQGLTQSLLDHTQQLGELRHTLVTTIEQAQSRFLDQWQQSQHQLQESHTAQTELISTVWGQFRGDLDSSRRDQQQALGELVQQIQSSTNRWQEQLQSATEVVSQQLVLLEQHTQSLTNLQTGEAELIRLEERLATNLETVRVVDTLEDTLHNLNAAVHVLTTRVKGKAA